MKQLNHEIFDALMRNDFSNIGEELLSSIFETIDIESSDFEILLILLSTCIILEENHSSEMGPFLRTMIKKKKAEILLKQVSPYFRKGVKLAEEFSREGGNGPTLSTIRKDIFSDGSAMFDIQHPYYPDFIPSLSVLNSAGAVIFNKGD